jgi:23S rRNA pseudouridine1911/1915/1917 synthase
MENRDADLIAGVWRLTVENDSPEKRLDQYLAGELPQLSRGRWRKVVDLGGIHLNGRRTRRCSTSVRPGDHIEAYLDGRPLEPFALEPRHIQFKDDYIIVLNKPAKVETQPTHARFVGTLYEALGNLLSEKNSNKRTNPTVGMIQRLDRDTTGLLVFSIHKRASAELTRQFSQRLVNKKYLALVAGKVKEPSGEFASLLAKSRRDNLVRSVPAGGKEAVTRFTVLESSEACSLVEVELLTGRSHQIRAHFSEAGHPLLGDGRYGGPMVVDGLSVDRQQLHAWQLGFKHPVSGDPLDFTAPPADDMQNLLNALGWNDHALASTSD